MGSLPLLSVLVVDDETIDEGVGVGVKVTVGLAGGQLDIFGGSR